MNWSDERYVRVYTRDTVEWLSWSWQAQSLFILLMRKVDRAGCLDLPAGPKALRGLSRMTGMPEDVIASAMPELEESGVLVCSDKGLVIRNYVEAQEATASGAERQRRYKDRQNFISGNGEHKEVTRGDADKREVTRGDSVPYRTVPSVPSEPGESPASHDAGPTPERSKPKREPKREPKPENPEAREVAEYLAAAIREHQPTAKLEPDCWVGDVDKALRIDSRTVSGLRGVIDWAHRREPRGFWRPNLRSGLKLREHYDRLESEIQQHAAARASPSLGRFDAPTFDYSYMPDLTRG